MIAFVSPPEWQELLAVARAGSQEALGHLLEAYRPLLLALANQELPPWLRPKVGASDLVQDTMLETLKDFSHFKGTTECELRYWLEQINRHNAFDLGRRFRDSGKRHMQSERPLPLDNLRAPAGSVSPLAEVLRQEKLEALDQTLEKLNAEDRNLITLRDRERLPFEAIARRQGCSEAAVRQRWLRALSRWRKELEARHVTL